MVFISTKAWQFLKSLIGKSLPIFSWEESFMNKKVSQNVIKVFVFNLGDGSSSAGLLGSISSVG